MIHTNMNDKQTNTEIRMTIFLAQISDQNMNAQMSTKHINNKKGFASVRGSIFGWGLLLLRGNNKVLFYFVGFAQNRFGCV